MADFVDLHCHSYSSDGEDSPAALIQKAVDLKLEVIALTDHDTVQGAAEFLEAGQGKINTVVGVEISCDQSKEGVKDIHLIGLFIDHTNTKLLHFLQQARERRITHKLAAIAKLQELGYEITFEEAAAIGHGEIARPHIAKVLVQKYSQQFPNVKKVFEQLLGKGKPADVYIPSCFLVDAIAIIHQAGGIAILAHPGHYSEEKFNSLFSYFIECGGDGLEGYYVYDEQRYKFRPDIDANAYFRQLAEKKKLAVSGGADYHGSIKTARIGDAKVPSEILTALLERADSYRIQPFKTIKR